jgi:nickel-dependent lactate racemase
LVVADSAAQQQFLGKIFDADTAAARAAVRQESEEITWLLGVQFAVQLVVGKNDQVVSVAAGHWNTVQQQTRRMLEGTWQRQANRRVDMVIATIRGGSISQGFEELGKALDNARMLVNPGGRIAVLSAIAASPGPSLRAAREMNNAPKALDQIRRHPPLDAISTWQIMRACSHARVYLLSRLAPDVVEELSITPVESVAELQRLVSESGSCAVLNDAPLVRVTLEKRDGEASG